MMIKPRPLLIPDQSFFPGPQVYLPLYISIHGAPCTQQAEASLWVVLISYVTLAFPHRCYLKTPFFPLGVFLFGFHSLPNIITIANKANVFIRSCKLLEGLIGLITGIKFY